MDLIPKEKRKLYDDEIQHFSEFHAAHITAEELNYLFCSLRNAVVLKQGADAPIYGDGRYIPRSKFRYTPEQLAALEDLR